MKKLTCEGSAPVDKMVGYAPDLHPNDEISPDPSLVFSTKLPVGQQFCATFDGIQVAFKVVKAPENKFVQAVVLAPIAGGKLPRDLQEGETVEVSLECISEIEV
jgi:hypothetical protein